jgi:hypothetical protein
VRKWVPLGAVVGQAVAVRKGAPLGIAVAVSERPAVRAGAGVSPGAGPPASVAARPLAAGAAVSVNRGVAERSAGPAQAAASSKTNNPFNPVKFVLFFAQFVAKVLRFTLPKGAPRFPLPEGAPRVTR